MAVDKNMKEQIIKDFAQSAGDTGSAQVQVALLTQRIKDLTEHGAKFPKDFSSKRGLLRAVAERRKLLAYLQATSVEQYKKTIERLGLRK